MINKNQKTSIRFEVHAERFLNFSQIPSLGVGTKANSLYSNEELIFGERETE